MPSTTNSPTRCVPAPADLVGRCGVPTSSAGAFIERRSRASLAKEGEHCADSPAASWSRCRNAGVCSTRREPSSNCSTSWRRPIARADRTLVFTSEHLRRLSDAAADPACVDGVPAGAIHSEQPSRAFRRARMQDVSRPVRSEASSPHRSSTRASMSTDADLGHRRRREPEPTADGAANGAGASAAEPQPVDPAWPRHGRGASTTTAVSVERRAANASRFLSISRHRDHSRSRSSP